MSKFNPDTFNALLEARRMVHQAHVENQEKGIKTLGQEVAEQEYIARETANRMTVNDYYERQRNSKAALDADWRGSTAEFIGDIAADSFASTATNIMFGTAGLIPSVSGQQELSEAQKNLLNKAQYFDRKKEEEIEYLKQEVAQQKEEGLLKTEKEEKSFIERRRQEIQENYALTDEEIKELEQEAVTNPFRRLGRMYSHAGGANMPDTAPKLPDNPKLWDYLKYVGHSIVDGTPFERNEESILGAPYRAVGSWLENVDTGTYGLGRTIREQDARMKDFNEAAALASDGEIAARALETPILSTKAKDKYTLGDWFTTEHIKGVGRADFTNESEEYYADLDRQELFDESLATGNFTSDMWQATKNQFEFYKRNPGRFAGDTSAQLKYLLPYGVGAASMVGDWDRARRDMFDAARSESSNATYNPFMNLDDADYQGDYLSREREAQINDNALMLLGVQNVGRLTSKASLKGRGVGTVATEMGERAAERVARSSLGQGAAGLVDRLPASGLARTVGRVGTVVGRRGGAIVGDAVFEGLQETAEGYLQAMGEGREYTGWEAGQNFGAGAAIGAGIGAAGSTVAGTGRVIDSSRGSFQDGRILKKYTHAELLDVTNEVYRPDLVVKDLNKKIARTNSPAELQSHANTLAEAKHKNSDRINFLESAVNRQEAIRTEITDIHNALQDESLDPEKVGEYQDKLRALIYEGNALPDLQVSKRELAKLKQNENATNSAYEQAKRKLVRYSNGEVTLPEISEETSLPESGLFKDDIDSFTVTTLASMGIDVEVFNPESASYDPVNGLLKLREGISELTDPHELRAATKQAEKVVETLTKGSEAYQEAKTEYDAINRTDKERSKRINKAQTVLNSKRSTDEQKAQAREVIRAETAALLNNKEAKDALKKEMADNDYAHKNLGKAKQQRNYLKMKRDGARLRNENELNKVEQRIAANELKLQELEANTTTDNTEAINKLREEITKDKKRRMRLVGARKSSTERKALQGKRKDIEKARSNITNMLAELATIEEQITDLEAQIRYREETFGLNDPVAAELREELNTLRARQEALRSEIQIANSVQFKVERELERDAEYEKYEQEGADTNPQTLQELNEAQEANNKKLEKLKDRLAVLKAKRDDAATVEEKASYDAAIEALNQDITDLQGDIKETAKKIKSQEANVKSEKDIAKDVKNTKGDKEAAKTGKPTSEEKAKLAKAIKDDQEIKKIEKQIAKTDEEIANLKAAKAEPNQPKYVTQALDAAIKALEDKKADLEDKLTGFDREAIDALVRPKSTKDNDSDSNDGDSGSGSGGRFSKVVGAVKSGTKKAAKVASKATEGKQVSSLTDRFLNIKVNNANLEDDDPLVSRIRNILGSADLDEDFELDLTTEEYKDLLETLRILDEEILREVDGVSMEGVSNDIISGRYNSEGAISFWGMQQYREEITKSILTNDRKQTRRLIGQLNRFYNDHSAKLQAANRAYGQYDKNDNQYVLKDKKGNWFNASVPQLEEQGYAVNDDFADTVKRTGGLYINENSGNLLDQMAIDNDFIGETAVTLKNTTDNFFKGNVTPRPTSTPASAPVQQQPQQQATQQSPSRPRSFVKPLTQEEIDSLGHFSKRFNDPKGRPLFTVIPKDPEDPLKGFVPTEAQELDVDNYDVGNHRMFRNSDGDSEQSAYIKSPRANDEFNRMPYSENGETKYGRAPFSKFVETETRQLQGTNKYIGFGSRPWSGEAPFDPSMTMDQLSDNDLKTLYKSDEGRIRLGYGGNANVLTSKGEDYRPQDVVAYHRDNDYNDSKEISAARKQELDAALQAGATIVTKPNRGGHSNNRVQDDIKYMLENSPHAYVEAASRNRGKGGSGVFYKVPTTEEEAGIVEAALKRTANAKRAVGSVEQDALEAFQNRGNNPAPQQQQPQQLVQPTQATQQQTTTNVDEGMPEYIPSDDDVDGSLYDSYGYFEGNEGNAPQAPQNEEQQPIKSVEAYVQDWNNYFSKNPNKVVEYSQAISQYGDDRSKYKNMYASLEAVEKLSDNSFTALKQVVARLTPQVAIEHNNSFNNLIPDNPIKVAKESINNGVSEESWQAIPMMPVEKEVLGTSGKIDFGKNASKLRQKDTVLNSEPEFFNKLMASKDEIKLAELANIPALKDSNKKQLDSFIRLHNKLRQDLDKVIRNPKILKDARNNPIYEYLIIPRRDEAGNIVTNSRGETQYTLDENVFTATVLGLYKYIQQQGHNPYLDAKGVNLIHGINKHLRLNQVEMLGLAKLGGHRNQVFQDVGKTAVQALGLRAGRNVPEHIIEQIEAGLGAVAYHLVQDDNPNAFFHETQLTHREQLGKLIEAMSAADFKKHLTELNKTVPGGMFFQDDNDAIRELFKIVRTKDDLREFLGIGRVNKFKNEDMQYITFYDVKRAYEYLNSSITLARPTISRDWDKDKKEVVTVYNPEILDILKSSERNDGSKDFLNELFSIDGGRITPRAEPIKSLNQLTVKKSDTGIPANMEEALVKAAQQPWIVQKERADFLIKMYDDPNMQEKFYNLMGVASNEELAMMHPEKRELRMADNAIRRELLDDQIIYLKTIRSVETGEYADYFQVPVVWVNQRVGYESTLFNAQTDLFARTLSGMRNWEAEVDPNDANFTKDNDGNEKLTTKGRFLIALAENMEGLSKGKEPKLNFTKLGYNEAAQTVDKVKASDFLEQFETYLASDADFLEAVDIIQESFDSEENTISDMEFRKIQKVMDDFGMDELGFGVLVEYAKYDLASKNGEKHTTYIGAQSDGVTNGPIITKMLLGEAYPHIRRMGGILGSKDVLDNEETDFFSTKKLKEGEWSKDVEDDTTLDLYQTTGLAMKGEKGRYFSGSVGTNIAKVFEDETGRGLNIVGNFGSRSWAKTLTTPFNYGAGIESLRKAISQDMFEKFQNEYYAIFETNVEEARKAQIQRVNKFIEDVVGNWNTIFVHPTDINTGKSQLREEDVLYHAEILAMLHNHSQTDLDKHVNPTSALAELRNHDDYRYYNNKAKSDLEFIEMLSKRLRVDQPVTLDRIPRVNTDNYAEPVNPRIELWLKNIAEVTYGTAATRAIQAQEHNYIKKRNALNKVAEHAYKNYALLKQVVTQMEAKDPNNITKAERKRIDAIVGPYTAAVASGMSNLGYSEEDGRRDTIKNGMNLLAPITQVNSGQKIRLGNKKFTAKGNSSKEINYSYAFRTEGEPGVRALALMIQSIDSAVSVQALAGDFAGMNFHDANVFGLNDFEAGVRAQNENFYSTIMNYEPARELAKAYNRPLYKLEKLMKDPKTPKELKDKIRNDIYKRTEEGNRKAVTPKDLAELMGMDIQKYQHTNFLDTVTGEVKPNTGDSVIHQYAGHDGQWVVSDRWKKIVSNRYKDYAGIKDGERKWEASRPIKESTVTKGLINSILKADTSRSKAIDNAAVLDYAFHDTDNFSKLLTELLEGDGKEVNVNQIAAIFKNHLDEFAEAHDLYGIDNDMYNDIADLKDLELKNVKVKLTDKKLLTGPKDAFATKEVPVLFSKFNNTVFINRDALGDFSSVNMVSIGKELLVASLHHNLKPIKNGSRANPELADQYKALKVLSDNISAWTNRALKDKHITREEAELIAKELGGRARKGNVEAMMTAIMYDTEGDLRAALSKVPNYFNTDKFSTGNSILDAFLNFISNLLDLAGHKNLYNAIYDVSSDLTRSIASNEDTLSARIKESYKRHEHPYTGEEIHSELHGYDTRFHFELAKAKYENKGKPLGADKVLNIVKQALNSERGDEGFKSTLLPVVEILQQSLKGSGEKIVLVDSIRDVATDVLNTPGFDIDTWVMKGRAFRDPDSDTIYLPTSSATSSASARVSTVVHELVHTLTQGQLSKTRTNAYKNLQALKKQAHDVFTSQPEEYWLMNGYSKDDVSHIKYATSLTEDTGVDEFFTEVSTSKAVRNFLRAIPKDESLLVGKGLTSKDSGFYNIAADALGVTGQDTANALYEFSRVFGEVHSKVDPNFDPNYDLKIDESDLEGTIEQIAAETSPEFTPYTAALANGIGYVVGMQKAKLLLDKDLKNFINKDLGKVLMQNMDIVNDYLQNTNRDGDETLIRLRHEGKTYTVSQAIEYLAANPFGDMAPKAAVAVFVDEAITQAKADRFLFSPDMEDPVNIEDRVPPSAVYEALGRNSTKDNSHLEGVIKGLVSNLMDKVPEELVTGYNYEQIWFDHVANDKDVYSSEALKNGFNLDAQQAYVLEVVESALEGALDGLVNTAAYRQLQRNYQQAKKQAKAEDFLPQGVNWLEATPEEQEIANKKFHYLFRPAVPIQERKSPYLLNFVGLSLVDPDVARVLNQYNRTRDTQERDIFERSIDVFKDAVEYLDSRESGVANAYSIGTQVGFLADRLGQIYWKNQDELINQKDDIFTKIEDSAIKAGEAVATYAKDVVTDLTSAKSNPLSSAIHTTLTSDLTDVDRFVNKVLDDVAGHNVALGSMRETINEVVGTLENPEHQDALNLSYASKAIEQQRGEIIETIGKAIQESYAEDNQELDAFTNRSVTNVTLRSDMQALLDDYSFDEVMQLLRDPKELAKEITKAEEAVEGLPYGNEYLLRAKGTAVYLATRKAVVPHLAKNARTIVERAGVGVEPYLEAPQSTYNNVDKVISLYALQQTRKGERDAVLRLYDSEVQNNDKPMTGLEYTVRSHKAIQEESKELFEDNPYSKVKGYLPNMTDPLKGFEVVTEDKIAEMEAKGYTLQGQVTSTIEHGTAPRYLMTTSNTGQQRYVSGVLSIEDTIKSGTDSLTYWSDNETQDVIRPANYYETKKLLKRSYKDFKPNLKDNFEIPSYSNDGATVGYSYEMSHAAMDAYLDRKNNSGMLLSQLKGANVNKKFYPDNNKRTVDYLIATYNEASVNENSLYFEGVRNKFVEIGPEAPTAKGRELWHSLPRETQIYAEEQTGEKILHVRNDELNLLFGFRKLDTSTIFDKEGYDRNFAEKLFAGVFEVLFKDKAQLRHNQAVTTWHEAVKLLKDYIVIRNFKVLMGNIMSNIAFLMVNKTDPKNALRDIKDALTYSLQYQNDMHELNKIKHEVKLGYNDASTLSRLAELNDAIARNPLADFIEAGMMPMIVNDMSFRKDEVNFETPLDDLKSATIGKLPSIVQSGLDQVLVQPGTPLYSFLSNATQQSDFVFKYALFKQEMRKGATKEEALKMARKVFIDYDVPTNKTMQAMNDNGVFMFSKFSLRIMRVLAYYMKNKPGKMVAEHLVSSEVFGNPSLMSLNFVSQMYGGRNMLNMPVDDVLTMYQNAAPVQLINAVIN